MQADDSMNILNTDALTGLRTLPSGAFQVALTSPPFYLLRRYGSAAIWPDGWQGELGHEPHPNDYVRHLLDVFDEVSRVLRDDGCLWVNLADTYNNKQGKKGSTNAPDGSDGRFAAGGRGYADSLRQQPEFYKHYISDIGHKSEMGVPYRFHLAMTDCEFRRFIGAKDGPPWICRRSVIWAKSVVQVETQRGEGNAMPEPTLDRPSRNYEFLFLFTKRPNYYFDRRKIDIPSRSGNRTNDRANAGSVWEADSERVLEVDAQPDGVWRQNPEASPYRHSAMWPRALVRQMLLPTARAGDRVIDPFAGSGTSGEVALELGLIPTLIEPSLQCRQALAARLAALSGTLNL
jgi:site-specific DNA-methyltransferase (cytosine-N4-specific)